MLSTNTVSLFFLIFILSWRCSPQEEQKAEAIQSTNPIAQPVSHHVFTALLRQHVSADGRVNYRAFLKDSTTLNRYLKTLSNNPPATNWSRAEKLAYWLNAYNGFTLQLVLRHYPLKSIKAIGSKVQIPFVNTPWDIKSIRIGDKWLDLNEIEHGILRKQFAEPRIHFAIVCASVSCPNLRTEAYTAAKLHQQLENQAREFINDTSRNKIKPDNIQVSKIFSWFKGDFTQKGTLIQFLNKYARVKINPNAQVSTLEYNWGLNE